jgi:thiazole synthase ThiGH ThiG subunit
MLKTGVSAVLTNTAVMTASEAEAQASAEPFKCNRLSSERQEKSLNLTELEIIFQEM